MCAVTPPLANKFWLSSTLTLPGLPRPWHGSLAARTRKALTTPTEPPVRNVSIGRGATASPRSVFSKATNASPSKPSRAGSDEKASKTRVSTRYAPCSESAVYERQRSGHAENPTRCQRTRSRTQTRKLFPVSLQLPIGDDVSTSSPCEAWVVF